MIIASSPNLNPSKSIVHVESPVKFKLLLNGTGNNIFESSSFEELISGFACAKFFFFLKYRQSKTMNVISLNNSYPTSPITIGAMII